ncbi:sulfotransferase family protein [Thermodesulfatator atlanticus]|uniref:sulfotransferase family protein n=1 Tax=Thermodesulfatator atlanticus TaxID=501497 RepID=UPI0003B61EBD|nr:sulfotransferase [Thermodesulfatator atlanticus]
MLPNFIGVGVQRSATTWIFECLREHSEIYVPPQKELHFFDAHFDKGLNWYKKFFEEAKGKKAVGEITPDYIYNYKALERIAATIPNVKILVSLRHPVDRAYSAYSLLKNSYYKDISFEEAFWQKEYIKNVGFYSKHIKVLYNLFPKKNVLIFLYDDILTCPERVAKEIYKFLDVDASFIPSSLNKTYNKILFPKIQSFLIKIKLEPILEGIKKSPMGHLIKKTFFYIENKKRFKKKKIDYQKYISVYEEDILELEKLINRDLKHWLKYKQ